MPLSGKQPPKALWGWTAPGRAAAVRPLRGNVSAGFFLPLTFRPATTGPEGRVSDGVDSLAAATCERFADQLVRGRSHFRPRLHLSAPFCSRRVGLTVPRFQTD